MKSKENFHILDHVEINLIFIFSGRWSSHQKTEDLTVQNKRKINY